MAGTKKPYPTIGVDKYTYFPITADTAEETTYGTAVELRGTVEIAPTDAGGNEVFDADNGAYCVTPYLEKMGHEITNADITPETDAAWRGLTLKNGGVEMGGDAKTVYFGVAWRIKKSDGTYRYVRYYKGAYAFASNVGGKTKPSEGAPEHQTAILEWMNNVLLDSDIKLDFVRKTLKIQTDISNGRNAITEYVVENIFKSPIWGHGVSTITYNSNGMIPYPHNFILQLFYDGGILLAVPVLFFVIKIERCKTHEMKSK